MEDDDDLMIGGDIVLHGAVGDAFMDGGFTPKQLMRALAGKGDVVVRLNSGGGFATDGAAIYAALKSHPGKVTMRVEGVAASAASLIAMAGDEIVMAQGALMMIHDPAALTIGTAADHEQTAAVLEKMGANYAAVYAARSGMDPDAVRGLMLAETWMTADEAVAMGFADKTDEPDEPEAVAAFDFTVYARAPQHLRALATENGWLRQTAPAAAAAHHPKEIAMTAKTEMAAPQKPADTPTPSQQEAIMAAETAAKAAADKAVAAERARIVAIRDGGAKLKLDAKMVDSLIAEGVDIDTARARMIDEWSKLGDNHEYAARLVEPRMSIARDERDTQREGMSAALAAQMERRAPETDKARPFMQMGIAEMAAHCAGDRGPLRTVADRERALMAGTHSTSDFPAIFENAMNKRLLAAYLAAVPSYRAIAARMDFTDFRPHPISGVGDWPTLLPVAEAGEIKFGTVADKKETVALIAHAIGLTITRQMIVNDELGAIDRILASRGRAVAAFEEQYFYAMMLSGSNADGPTLLETGRQVFNTTDLTKASAGAAIIPASIGIGEAAMRKRKGISGEAFLAVQPRVLLTGPDKRFEALQVLAPIQAAAAGNVNPYSGAMDVVTSSYITGNAWYLFASPGDVPVFMYGYLEGQAGPRLTMREPFTTQGLQLKVELDFGVGAIDFRGGFKNAGA